MNTISLLRNAFMALSLGAFLISPARAGVSNQDFEAKRSSSPVSVSNTPPSHDEGGDERDINELTANELPSEMLAKIFMHVPMEDLDAIYWTSHTFRSALSPLKNTEQFQIRELISYFVRCEQSSD